MIYLLGTPIGVPDERLYLMTTLTTPKGAPRNTAPVVEATAPVPEKVIDPLAAFIAAKSGAATVGTLEDLTTQPKGYRAAVLADFTYLAALVAHTTKFPKVADRLAALHAEMANTYTPKSGGMSAAEKAAETRREACHKGAILIMAALRLASENECLDEMGTLLADSLAAPLSEVAEAALPQLMKLKAAAPRITSKGGNALRWANVPKTARFSWGDGRDGEWFAYTANKANQWTNNKGELFDSPKAAEKTTRDSTGSRSAYTAKDANGKTLEEWAPVLA